MAIPSQVEELVERFQRNIDVYKRYDYKETRVRVEFVDPFFEALGWDVRNVSGYAEQYKDVVHEDALKVGGATRAPDYCFRIGGTRKFFLEVKKPSVAIQEDIGPAYQLRRYAWSAKLPLSILTDFEELAVYDCRLKPRQNDKTSVGRVMCHTFDQYVDRWDEIYGTFAKEAVLQGSFDKYVRETEGKRGTSEVDDEFLKEIEGWREALARNIALRNPALSVHELNFAVQRTIDRFIFLRMCEDRGIEIYGRLHELISGEDIYHRLGDLYRRADEKYNAGIFDFKADKLSLELTIDDKVLKPILDNMYYPQCPYEFSVLPAEVLGQVYEQFLGKVIRLTPSHRAVVEEKPEVKKAGGVYYTPTYIVDYIVEQTVGKLVEDKTPRQISRLRILDPACGSGSFLLGAYQYLLDYHLQWYEANDPEKHARRKKPTIYQDQKGSWRLTTAEKKRILINNIYGVDIDRQAVEVSKLSLLLKVLDGETNETLVQQLSLWRERALPNLAENIKCGNSLISTDFFSGQLMPDEEEIRRINPFDWNVEYRDVFESGGFDAVIGNPPYGIVFDDTTKPYLEEKYPAFVRNNDMYIAFAQKGLCLLKTKGLFGYIIPNTFLLGPYFDVYKQYVLDRAGVVSIIDFSTNQVFQQPNVFTSLLFIKRRSEGSRPSKKQALFVRVRDISSFPEGLSFEGLTQDALRTLRWVPMNPLVTRLYKAGPHLGDIAWVKDVGLNYWTKGRGKTRGGSIADRVLYEGKMLHPTDRPYLKGRDIGRYASIFGNHWLRHDYESRLNPKVDTLRFSPEYLEREKIVYRQTADSIIATIDSQKMLTNKTLHTVVLRDDWQHKLDLRYILGILNSSIMTYLYKAKAQEEGRTFAQVKIFRIKELPVIVLDTSQKDEKNKHDKIVSLAEQMLELNNKLTDASLISDKKLYKRQINAVDAQINALVYELYGLTEEEIKTIEGKEDN